MKRSTFRSVLALALAGLWAVLPLVGALHDEDHAHRYCAEHGVLEEAPGGPGSSLREGISAAAAGDEGEHLSCAFDFLHHPEDGLEGAPGGVPVEEGAELSAAGLLAADGVEALPVLARAPKASPPGC